MVAAAAAEADAAAAAATDLGPQLGMSPATPDIVRKPARPSGTTGADGSCCTALFPAEPAPAGCGKVESSEFSSLPLSVEEQSQPAPEDLGEVDCAVSTQESSTSPAQVWASPGKIAPQKEGVANGSGDAAAAAPVPTPDKVEPTPRRWLKKSTKGLPRFKVFKDKVMKPKVILKNSTPGKLTKKKRTLENDSEHVGTSSSSIAKRKLDLDSSESKPCFSRVTLMGNLRSLAKSRGLRDDPDARMRSKRGKKRKLMTFKHQESGRLAMVPYQSTPTDASSSAVVPLVGFTHLDIVRHGNHGKKLQTKVLGLDEKTLQVYDVLRKWDEGDSESFEGFDIGSGPEWDETRGHFERCVDIFIATMNDLLGNDSGPFYVLIGAQIQERDDITSIKRDIKEKCRLI